MTVHTRSRHTDINQPTQAPLIPSMILGVLALASALGLWWIGYGAGFAPFPPFDLADQLIRLAPGDVATWAIANLQFNARPLAMAGGIVLILAYGLLAGVILRQWPRSMTGALIGAVSSIPCVAIAFANDQASGPLTAIGLLFWFGATLALPLALAGHRIEALWISLREQERGADSGVPPSHTRRDLLVRSVASAAAFGFGGWTLGTLLRSAGLGGVETADSVALAEVREEIQGATDGTMTFPTPVATQAGELDSDVPDGVRPRNTPNDEFYVLDINTRKPAISELGWLLKVHGLVERPLELTYADLLGMPAVEMDGTLMCISYTHGNNLISSTRWTGVPLRDVLQQAGIGDGTFDVVLRGEGGYSDSIPIAKALESHTLLAYGMNGVSLPRDHGFPCRLFVPDIYGEKNVKWLQEIELVDHDYKGYWQDRGWSDDAQVRTMSAIDVPVGEVERDPAGIVQVGGIAFAGARGINKVEIRVDEGEWLPVEVEAYKPDLVWQRWWYDWPVDPGSYLLSVRATDGTGMLQDAEERSPYPDGMTGLHRVRARVV